MKILVIGGSRGTGALCVKAALKAGHSVTAFSRNPNTLDVTHPNLVKRAGNFHDAASVNAAVAGHDAVIITASVSSFSDFKTTSDYFSKGTRFCIDAMKQAGAKRLVVLSAFGVGDSARISGVFLRFLVWLFLKNAFADHDVQERMARESGLEWIVARPTRLSDGPAAGRFVKVTEVAAVPGVISRADVADFMVEACVGPTWVGKTVHLGG